MRSPLNGFTRIITSRVGRMRKKARIRRLETRWRATTKSDPRNAPISQNSMVIFESLSVWVLNLRARPDRLVNITSELARMGFSNWKRIEAIHGKTAFPSSLPVFAGSIACTLGHITALTQGLAEEKLAVMVCEDDLEFKVEPGNLRKIIQEFLDEPSLDVLSISGRARGGGFAISPSLRLVVGLVGRGCYLVKPHAVLPLIRAFSQGIELLSSGKIAGKGDLSWRRLQESELFFASATEKIAQQRGDYSDIEDSHLGPR